MNDHRNVGRIIQLGAAAAAMCLATTGAVSAQEPVATVAVFSDHYVFEGRSFDDLDRLEDAVMAARPRGVRLEACGGGTTRAQGAAAHRFRNMYLDLRVSYADDTSCAAVSAPRAVPVGQRFGARPYGIDEEAVARWWNGVSMP